MGISTVHDIPAVHKVLAAKYFNTLQALAKYPYNFKCYLMPKGLSDRQTPQISEI